MGRSLVRVVIAMFTALVFLLIQSVFWSPRISIAIAAAVVGLIVIAYFRPHNALLVLAALAPLGAVWSPLFSDRMRGAEAFVLAFLVGALLRGWTLHRFKDLTLDRLRIAALVFGTVVALSCVQQLRNRGAEPGDLLGYLVERYVTSFGGYGTIFSAMLLTEGLALLVYGAHYCRTQPDFAWRLVRMLVIGGVSAASFNFWFFVHELIETGQPAAHVGEFFLNTRWSAHVGDVNAAGSFFAMIMLIAVGLALKDRVHRVAWFSAGLVTGLALWMTASRTALVAVAFVGAASLAKTVLWRSAVKSRAASVALITLTLLTVVAAGYVWFWFHPLSVSASQAVIIRWEFLGTTWRMLQAYPLFGVGIGQYANRSAHFSSPELLATYPRENAHNNFAQVAGELGFIGLAAFLAVLAICLWFPVRSRRHDPVVGPVLAGLTTFIVSWLGGHPLLVSEVAYPFWIALAVVASERLT